MVLPDRIELSTSPLPMECSRTAKSSVFWVFQVFREASCQKRASINNGLSTATLITAGGIGSRRLVASAEWIGYTP